VIQLLTSEALTAVGAHLRARREEELHGEPPVEAASITPPTPPFTGGRYECSACNIAAESFRAIDNVPNHAHLCKECARLLPEPIMAHYAYLGKEPRGVSVHLYG